MKAQEVRKELQISKTTLHRYFKNGTITGVRLPTGKIEYDRKSVEAFKRGITPANKTIIYVRLQKFTDYVELDEQIEALKVKAKELNLEVDNVYKDLESGLQVVTRPGFRALMKEIEAGQVQHLLVVSKDRLTRLDREGLFKRIEDLGVELLEFPELKNWCEEEELEDDMSFLANQYITDIKLKVEGTTLTKVIEPTESKVTFPDFANILKGALANEKQS